MPSPSTSAPSPCRSSTCPSTVLPNICCSRAIGVVREPLVAVRDLRQPLDRLVGEADVEDRLHHPRHRELRAGPHRHQQRVTRIAQLLAARLLQRLEVLADLGAQPVGLLALREIGAARGGADREPPAAPATPAWSSPRGLPPCRPAGPSDPFRLRCSRTCTSSSCDHRPPSGPAHKGEDRAASARRIGQ
jgi:hypothetical protein